MEVIGDATLYLGDCLEILPSLGKADAVVTDPPYGTKVTGWDDSITQAHIAACIGATDGYCVFFYSNTRLWHLLGEIRALGRDAWTMVWHKSNAMGFERRFAPQWVPVVCVYPTKGQFWGQDYISCPIVPQDVDHPTPKPLGVTNWLVVRATASGDTVLDPFMGSGTTGVAAVSGGRRFVGIEREPKYFDIACRRIEDAQRQGRLIA
jgi:predicted RNA methylase